jgi:hypothetical protein
MKVKSKTFIMKTLASVFLSFCLLLTLVVACTKNSRSSSDKSTLTLSNTKVKMGEPLIVTTNALSGPGLVTRWSVTPALNSWISPSSNSSVIVFSNPGTYVVTASYFSDSTTSVPYDSSYSPVIVTDSVYTNDSTVHCGAVQLISINSGDQITLTPLPYTSDTGLVLIAHTQNLYGNQYPYLNYTFTEDMTGGYHVDFTGVSKYPCGYTTDGATPATSILSFNSASGTHDIIITLNGTTYTGSLVVTDTSYTFTWSYTSGVIISPLQIQKP